MFSLPAWLRAFVDKSCSTTETDDSNNQLALSYRVTGRLPDFVSPVLPWLRSVVPWDEPTQQPCGGFGDALLPVGTLAARASKVFNFAVFEAGTAGSKTLRTFVDYTCIVNEANETNNQLTKT